MTNSFSAAIGQWASESKERATAVYRRSFELLGEEMARSKNEEGGRLPYKTGNLSRSILASTQGMPKTATGPFSGSNVGVVAATLQLDQPAWIGYQAIYARRMNYGYVGADKLGRVFNQAGSYFVEGAIEAWPKIVAQAAKEIQGAVEGRQ